VKVLLAGLIDPQRAKRASKEAQDVMFTKLDCYVKLLHAEGKVTWKSACHVPQEAIYNMDKVGTDTTKHRATVIVDAEAMVRLFQITPEGDGKVNMHHDSCQW
jgi:hypothetical protein